MLSGSISLVPDNETVSITLNGVTQQATVTSGTFSSIFTTSALGVTGSPYTMTYSYGGDADLNGTIASELLKVTRVTPTMTVIDAGGTYNTNLFPATGRTVTGVGTDGTIASFGSPLLSYTYYQGRAAAGARVNAGSYTVVAHYAGSATTVRRTARPCLLSSPRPHPSSRQVPPVAFMTVRPILRRPR